MFNPIRYDSGDLIKMKVANSVAVVKGAAMVDDGNGLLTLAASGTAVDIRYVAMETVTTTSSGQEVLMVKTFGVQFEADADAAIAQTDCLTYVDLATNSTINPDAVTNQLFFLESIVGAAGVSTKGLGYFSNGVPNS
jgi:hypothetical protein